MLDNLFLFREQTCFTDVHQWLWWSRESSWLSYTVVYNPPADIQDNENSRSSVRWADVSKACVDRKQIKWDDKVCVSKSFILTNGFDGDDGEIKCVNESDVDSEHESSYKWTKGNTTEQHDDDDDERTLLRLCIATYSWVKTDVNYKNTPIISTQ